MVTPVLQAVCPYRLRGLGTAMGVMYVVFIGGFARRHPRRLLHRTRSACAAPCSSSAIPSSIIGGLLLMNGARYIRNDLSLVVEELLEEQEEHRKRADEGARHAGAPGREHRLLVRPGAGAVRRELRDPPGRDASRCSARTARASRRSCASISGLEVPERGVVRLNGRNITYVAPEQRARHGHRAAAGRQGRVPEPHRRRRTSRSAPRLNGGTRAEIDAAHRRRCSSCSPSSPSGASSRRAACRAASSRCSRSPACSCTSPRSC